LSFKSIYQFVRRNLEAFIWIAALLTLAFSSPIETCYSLCPLANWGFDWCPGCGLGTSITWLFRGEIMNSWHAHPLGIPAVIIITARIISIFRKNKRYSAVRINKSLQNG
jgi:hypothetical protein